MADLLAVADGFVVGGGDLIAHGAVGGAGEHDLFEADHFDNFFEDGGATSIDEAVEESADGGITGQTAGAVAAAAFSAPMIRSAGVMGTRGVWARIWSRIF